MAERSEERGTIITVCRNNLHLTKKAVASFRAQDVPCDILVIDNASSDGTAQWLNTQNIPRISLREQISLAAAWNRALKAVWSMGRTQGLVCNNDVELRPDAYYWLRYNGGPFVTCVSVDSVDQLNYPNPPTTERNHPDFSAFLIRKEVTDKVGFFNEAYFPAYTEDCEFHVRCHRSGIRCICIDIPFLHHGAGTIKNCSASERAVIERGADANRERFRKTYGCLPGTKEYEKLFEQQEKPIDAVGSGLAAPTPA